MQGKAACQWLLIQSGLFKVRCYSYNLSMAGLLVQGKTTCPTCPKTWHCYQEGGKEARDNSIEWSYKTNVSASFELYEVYIGPLIGLWWTNVVRREDLQRFESGWRWPFWH